MNTDHPMTDELLVRVAEQMKALADPTRLRLLHLLREGESCVGDLVTAVHGTQANVSKHLAVLRSASLVKARRVGMNVLYSVEEPVVFDICRMMCGCLERQALDLVADLERGAGSVPPSPKIAVDRRSRPRHHP